MKKKYLFLIVSLFLIGIASSSPLYYKILMNYDNGDIKIDSIDVVYSLYDLKDNYGDYVLGLVDNNGKIDYFPVIVPNQRVYDFADNNSEQITRGEIVKLDQVIFEIYIPYKENSKEIIIYDSSKKELTAKNLNAFSKEQTITNTEYKNNTIPQISESNKYFLIGLIFIIIVISSVILFFYFKNNKFKKK